MRASGKTPGDWFREVILASAVSQPTALGHTR